MQFDPIDNNAVGFLYNLVFSGGDEGALGQLLGGSPNQITFGNPSFGDWTPTGGGHFEAPVEFDVYYPGKGRIGVFKATAEIGGYVDPQTADPSQIYLKDPQYYDLQGNPVFTLNSPTSPFADLLAAAKVGADWYDYQISLFNGDDKVALRAGPVPVEVGAGGTATISGGSGNQVWIWHDKNIVWTTTGTNNALIFSWEIGSGNGPATGLLMLDLKDGTGTNPWGGTLSFQGVDRVAVGEIANEYVLCNNDGDTINSGFGTFDGGGNALVVGGTGNDALSGLDISVFGGSIVNVLVAGPGTDTLSGGRNTFFDARTVSNIFSYNLGADTITNFRAGTGSGDQFDLSAVPGVNSFADVQGLMHQSGANTIIDFGGGHTITLDNVTASSLTAGNFLFAPEASFAFTNPGEADANTTVKIYLAMTGAVTVDTTHGSPTLRLSDGAVATYDAAASSAAGHVLVFDYAVGANDHSPDLAVQSVDLNGAVVSEGNGHSVDFSPVQNETLGLQVNKSLLSVDSVTTSASSGELDAGSTITFTLNMSESNFTIDTSHGRPFLTLNDGETATYAGFSGNEIDFSYTVKAGDHTSDLTVTGVSLGYLAGETAVVQDANGYNADFSGAANFAAGVQIGPTLFPESVRSDAATNPATTGREANAGLTVQLIVQMNEAATVSGSPTLSLSDGGTATYNSSLSNLGAGTLIFDYTVGSGDQSPDLRVTGYSGGTIEDANNTPANFSGAFALSSGLQIGASPLTVTSLQASTSGHVAIGQTVFLTLQMSEAVTVSFAPRLTLNDGEEAFYDSTDSNAAAGALVFEYIVGNDIADPNAANLEITGLDLGQNSVGQSSLRDAAGYNADISAAIGVSTGIQVNHPLSIASLSDNWTTSEADSGQTVEIYLNMTEGVTVNTSGGTPTLTLNDGATATYDAAASNLNTGQIAFAYHVGATDRSPFLSIAAVNLNNGAIQDTNNSAADLTLPANTMLAGEDNSIAVPLQIGPATVDTMLASQVGTIGVGQSIKIGIGFSEFITIDTTHGTPTLTLSDGATAAYDATGTALNADSVIFDYTVGTGDASGDLEIKAFNLNDASITDLNSTNVDTSIALNQFFGVDVETGTPCYCPATLITTRRGQKKVERLQIGDLVRTMSGELRPIKWIGRRSYHRRFVRGRKDILPICIRAGALGENLPRRNLWISPCHAMYLEGVLIEAKDLVNGVSIVQAERPEKVEYYHVELESHDVIIAEGAFSESFIDDDSRAMFHNAHEYYSLYPDRRSRPAQYCAPRLEEGFQVDAARRQIALRAGLLRAADPPRIGPLRGFVDEASSRRIAGWAQNIESPGAPVCLDIFAGGRLIGRTLANEYREDLKLAGLGSGRHSFEFTPPAGLALSPDVVEIRRSLDGAAIARAAAATRPAVSVHRRAARA